MISGPARYSRDLGNYVPQVGAAVVLFLALLVCFFTAVSEPVGDDVLNHFEKGLSLYVGGAPNEIGSRVTSFGQVLKMTAFGYFNWSGRVTGHLFMNSIALIPPLLRAVLTAAIYTLNILLALRLVYGNLGAVLRHPLSYTALFLAVYWYKPDGSYTRMWTMLSVYGIPLLLCLLYLNVSSEKKGPQGKRSLICLQLLGLFTGLSHEIYGAVLISMLGTDWLRGLLAKEHRWTSLFRHTGLGIGYLFCFFAPGNFNRMMTAHDATIFTVSLPERIQASLTRHQETLDPNWLTLDRVRLILLALAVVSLLADCRSRGISQTGKQFLSKNLSCIVGGAISILAWGCVSYVPSYGVDMWICLTYIVLLRTIDMGTLTELVKRRGYDRYVQVASAVAGAALCLLLLRTDYAWLKSYSATSLWRQELISAAVAEGRGEVTIPAYDGRSWHRSLVWLGALNPQGNFDSYYYTAYWGTHVTIDQPDGG